MKDKEFIVYRIGTSNKYRPYKINYATEREARDTALRLSEKEQRKYYVFEVVEVINTIDEVGADMAESEEMQ